LSELWWAKWAHRMADKPNSLPQPIEAKASSGEFLSCGFDRRQQATPRVQASAGTPS
jgi:hypothetical protein